MVSADLGTSNFCSIPQSLGRKTVLILEIKSWREGISPSRFSPWSLAFARSSLTRSSKVFFSSLSFSPFSPISSPFLASSSAFFFSSCSSFASFSKSPPRSFISFSSFFFLSSSSFFRFLSFLSFVARFFTVFLAARSAARAFFIAALLLGGFSPFFLCFPWFFCLG